MFIVLLLMMVHLVMLKTFDFINSMT